MKTKSSLLDVLANPFVVLVDITIALSFMMMCYAFTATIIGSKTLEKMNRSDRQNKFISTLVTSIEKYYGKDNILVWTDADGHVFILEKSNEANGLLNSTKISTNDVNDIQTKLRPYTHAIIFKNANFLRISIIDKQFNNNDLIGNSINTSEANSIAKLHKNIAQLIFENWNDLDYVYLHGITTTQCENEADEEILSNNNVKLVMDLWQRSGFIGPYKSKEERIKNELIPRNFIIMYGTGGKLYDTFGYYDRVDILLFYKDYEQIEEQNNASK